jgi:hypothetical protein
MKNQYFADVNDYRKYGLLRCLVGTSGLRTGVCWMLTAADNRSDGKFVEYWKQPERWRKHDPGLFDALSQCSTDPTQRNVDRAAKWELVPGAIYYSRLLPDAASDRERYFAGAWETLGATDLIFFDPDNGLEVPSVPRGTRNSSKYLYWPEAQAAFDGGHSILIYQHFQRKTRISFTEGLARELGERTKAAGVFSFSTAHVLFLLAVQDHHLRQVEAAQGHLHLQWTSQIRPARHNWAATAVLPSRNGGAHRVVPWLHRS